MRDWMNSCGTVGCIGGWCEKVAGSPEKFGTTEDDNPQLYALQMAPGYLYGHKPIRPRHAAIALRSYLTHGDPRWQKAMKA